MPLTVIFQGGPEAGKRLDFDDSIERITFGRSSERCQVVFGKDQPSVGHEHFAVQRCLGRYRLVLNRDDVVLVGNRRATDGEELDPRAEVRLGRRGPKLILETTLPADFRTEGREYQAGVSTELRMVERSTQTMRRLGLPLALLLLLAVGLGGYAWWHGTAEARIQRQLEAARPSVYLVLKKTGDAFDTIATAWVIDQENGRLATNAHVAAEFLDLGPDAKMVVRSSVPTVQDFEVTSVKIHPGYEQFLQIWDDYDPVIRTSPTTKASVGAPGPACDVALLIVDKPEGLGKSLKPAENVEKLFKAGYPVGYLGYPMEGLAMFGVNLEAPEAPTHRGYVVACTTYFDSVSADAKDRLLVQHSLPLAGGASGSPMINADGEVVAVLSGGNAIGNASDARIMSSANIGFAQRIDLVEELLKDSAPYNQVQRATVWNSELRRHYGRRGDIESAIEVQKAFDNAVQSWTIQAEDGGLYTLTSEKTGSLPLELPQPIVQNSQISISTSFDVYSEGDYMIAAAGPADISLSLKQTDPDGNTRELTVGGKDYNCRWAAVHARAGTKFDAALSSFTPQKAELRWYRGTQSLVATSDRFTKQVNQWLQQTRVRVPAAAASAVIHKEAYALGEQSGDKKPSVQITFNRLAAGRYLLVAVPEYEQNATLARDDQLDLNAVLESSPGGGRKLAKDELTHRWAENRFEIAQPSDVTATVVGGHAGRQFELRLYCIPDAHRPPPVVSVTRK